MWGWVIGALLVAAGLYVVGATIATGTARGRRDGQDTERPQTACAEGVGSPGQATGGENPRAWL